MTSQLRVVAAVAVVSGLTAAGAVFAQDRFGLATLPPDRRRRR